MGRSAAYRDVVTSTVLIAEDDRAVRTALTRALELEGYRVTTAPDGAAALEMLERERPDVVVLDVMMPNVDGLNVCRRMRARGDLTPVLLLTARVEVSDRVSGLDAGLPTHAVRGG